MLVSKKKLKGTVDAKPQTAAKPRVLCQAENVFSRAATEEGSTGNPDSPTTRCAAHIQFASSAASTRDVSKQMMIAQRKEKSFCEVV